MLELFHSIVDVIFSLGYLGIFLLMVIESSFIPFPSEVVMIPAGYLVFKGQMDGVTVLLVSIIGCLVGALFNYYISMWLGRALLLKYGKYFFVPSHRLHQMEHFFEKHGAFSTFVGRLIPVIRQLISVPAGLVRMNIVTFSTYTTLGASIWMVVLFFIGYFVGHQEELVAQLLGEVMSVVLVLVVVAVVVYVKCQSGKGPSSSS